MFAISEWQATVFQWGKSHQLQHGAGVQRSNVCWRSRWRMIWSSRRSFAKRNGPSNGPSALDKGIQGEICIKSIDDYIWWLLPIEQIGVGNVESCLTRQTKIFQSYYTPNRGVINQGSTLHMSTHRSKCENQWRFMCVILSISVSSFDIDPPADQVSTRSRVVYPRAYMFGIELHVHKHQCSYQLSKHWCSGFALIAPLMTHQFCPPIRVPQLRFLGTSFQCFCSQ